ncbi:MAG: type II toxin-antitoxin system VapC family toxin [Chloroflexi bacterium]|nr:type II toxin-antitoxin system VapC family toxin [Chloroflexota bacterium]
MNYERLFLDTAFILALVNSKDRYHAIARELLPRVQSAHQVWITEAVLVEVANALSVVNRKEAVRFIRQCYHTPNIHVVGVDTLLLIRALDMYDARTDKGWGLTDCISFVVMHDQGIFTAVTADRHFIQAGFQALMLEFEQQGP